MQKLCSTGNDLIGAHGDCKSDRGPCIDNVTIHRMHRYRQWRAMAMVVTTISTFVVANTVVGFAATVGVATIVVASFIAIDS